MPRQPGVEPASNELETVARATLGIDEEPSASVPVFYIPILKEFLTTNPYDVRLILELAQPRNGNSSSTLGGNGFGVATCMEEFCWKDVILSADPERELGGRMDGLGSLSDYRDHCKEEVHLRGRNLRCQQAGITILPPVQMHPQVAAIQESRSSTAGGIPVLPNKSADQSQQPFFHRPGMPSGSGSRLSQQRDSKATPNIVSVNSGLASNSAVFVGSDSDDEVIALSDVQIPPGLRKTSNRNNPIALLDDEDERSDTPSMSTQNVASTSQVGNTGLAIANRHPSRPPVPVASLVQKLSHWRAELQATTVWFKHYQQARGGRNLLVYNLLFRRVFELQGIVAAGGLKPYTSPDPQLLALVPSLATHASKSDPRKQTQQTDKDIIRDYLARANSAAGPSRTSAGPANAVAGPSGATGPFTFPPFRQEALYPPHPQGGYADLLGGIDAAVSALGDGAFYPEDFEDEWDANVRRGPQDLQKFFEDNLKDFSEDVSINEALVKLNMKSPTDKFAEMTITLMPHQILGVSFMIEKEKNEKFRGGILGDAMGLGKTVQAISCMSGNPSPEKKVQTTLIVAPLALLQQWRAEIEGRTTEGAFKVMIYHGSNRTRSTNELKRHDVVLTTYGVLSGEYPKEMKEKRRKKRNQTDSEDDEPKPEVVIRKKGPLFKMKWYRVILDEAHTIRNKNTQAAKAVFELDAVLRWSLTGTLIINSLDDIFSHLHFTSISPSRDWQHFRDSIASRAKRNPKLATKRAHAILRTCMLRRTKDSEVNGKKILTLPEKTISVVELVFTPEERAIYTQVELRARVRFNKFLRQGTVLKNYSVVLVLLLRLRQLCNHPYLLKRKSGEPIDINDLTVSDEDLFGDLDGGHHSTDGDLERAVALMGQDFVDKVQQKMKDKARALGKNADEDEGDDNEDCCPVCFDTFTDERITSCAHSFCAGCLEEIFNAPLRDATDLTDDQVVAGVRKCPCCRQEIERTKIFRADAFLEPRSASEDYESMNEDEGAEKVEVKNEDGEQETRSSTKSGKKRMVRVLILMGNATDAEVQFASDDEDIKEGDRKKGKGKVKEEDAQGINLAQNDEEYGIEDVLPSTKMIAMGDLIDQFYTEDPTQKVLVFSQFTSYISLLGLYLGRKGIPHVSYVGSMNQSARTEAVQQFGNEQNRNGPRIMLISLKCGGTGLNLTRANKVINCDLAWNFATECQAYDRAHRIGQTRPVGVSRLVIRNSVEQRILELQATKQGLADGAMGEGAGGRMGRLGVRELIRLFGGDEEDGGN
ncbi:hypothetical protein P7C73_g2588, partial [Tremellales sp. Uapishka_1]